MVSRPWLLPGLWPSERHFAGLRHTHVHVHVFVLKGLVLSCERASRSHGDLSLLIGVALRVQALSRVTCRGVIRGQSQPGTRLCQTTRPVGSCCDLPLAPGQSPGGETRIIPGLGLGRPGVDGPTWCL